MSEKYWKVLGLSYSKVGEVAVIMFCGLYLYARIGDVWCVLKNPWK